MSNEKSLCELCGEPMPDGEQMFKYHGYSGACPKPPLPKGCKNHPDRPIRENLDGDDLCQECCIAWAKNEEGKP